MVNNSKIYYNDLNGWGFINPCNKKSQGRQFQADVVSFCPAYHGAFVLMVLALPLPTYPHSNLEKEKLGGDKNYMPTMAN